MASLVQFCFFGVPVHAANLSSRLQWRIVAVFFFLRPFFGTHGLRKTPKLQVVLLAQVPSVSKSQALCPRESDGKSYLYLIFSSIDNPCPDRLPWKSLMTPSRLMMGFLHLSCNLPTLSLWGFIHILNHLLLMPMISGSCQ